MDRRICFLCTVALLAAPQAGLAEQAPTPFPAMVARLGSRLTLLPRKSQGAIDLYPLGPLLPAFGSLTLTGRIGSPNFAFPKAISRTTCRQEVTPTSVAYTLPLDRSSVALTFESPLTPTLPRFRFAPFFYLRVAISNRANTPKEISLRWSLGDAGRAVSRRGFPSIVLRKPIELSQPAKAARIPRGAVRPGLPRTIGRLPPFRSNGTGTIVLAARPAGGFAKQGSDLVFAGRIGPGETLHLTAALAFHTRMPVLLVDGTPRRFYYSRLFKNAAEIARAALDRETEIEKDSNRFLRIVGDRQGPEARLLALGLASYLSNTWLVEGADGEPWRFSVWEGFPKFHATLDVLFNNSPFYLLAASDLLRNLLRHYPDYAVEGHVPHDVGQRLVIGGDVYPARMDVEEDSSFLLLHFLYLRRTGDRSLWREQSDFLQRIATGLLEADTDGDTFPDRGVTNTFDDAPATINAAPNQIYLAIKTAAALHAYYEVDGTAAYEEAAERILARVRASWLGDHYPIALSPPRLRHHMVLLDGIKPHRPLSIESYSNYAAHGLVPLLMAGDFHLAAMLPRLGEHLLAAHRKTATKFGDAHYPGSENVWVSQNIWRDLAALYLGQPWDMKAQLKRYEAVELQANKRNDPRWQGFCDSPENRYLTWYSRGTALLWLPFAETRSTPLTCNGE